MKRSKWVADKQHGQDLIEFAIALPLLFLVVFGVLDLGRLFHASITLTNAAREGARYGARNPDDFPGVVTAALAEAANSGIELTTADVYWECPDVSGCGSGLPLQVQVRYNFDFLIPLVFTQPTLELVRSTEMMVP